MMNVKEISNAFGSLMEVERRCVVMKATSEKRYLGPYGSNGLLDRTDYTEQVSFSPPFKKATIAGYFTEGEGASIGFYWDKSSRTIKGGSLAADYTEEYCTNNDCSITPATDGSGNSVSKEYLYGISTATGGLLAETTGFMEHLIDDELGFGFGKKNPKLKEAFKFMKPFSQLTLAFGLISAFFPSSGPSEIEVATQEIVKRIDDWGEKILDAIKAFKDLLEKQDVDKEIEVISAYISSMKKALDASLSEFQGLCNKATLWNHFSRLYDNSCLEEFCTLPVFEPRPSYKESWVGIVRDAAENQYETFIKSYSKIAISMGIQLLELYSLCAPENTGTISMMEVGIVEMTQQLSDFVYRTKTAPGLGETCLATPAKDCKVGLFCADNNNECCKSTYTKNGGTDSYCGGKVYGEKCSENKECEGDLKCIWEFEGGGKHICCDESYDNKYCKRRVWDICPGREDDECMGSNKCGIKMWGFDHSYGCCPEGEKKGGTYMCSDWYDFVEGYDSDSYNLTKVNGNWNQYNGRLAVSKASIKKKGVFKSYGFNTDMYVKGDLKFYEKLKKIDYGYRGDIDRSRGLYINRTRKIKWHLGYKKRDKYPQWPGDFKFSNSVNLGSDWNCVNVKEPTVAITDDNWFCEEKKTLSHGIKWSTNGPLGGKRCTKIEAPAMPGFYENTYLCVDHSSPLHLYWSSAGITAQDHCQQWKEELPGWKDNSFLCADKDPFPQWPGDFEFSNSVNLGSDWNCVNVKEPTVPITDDNWFCEKKKALSHGIEWSTNGPLDGKRCTKIEEAAMSGYYEDTYLCVNHSSPLHLYWSSAGPDKERVEPLKCQKWQEDIPSWDDNYLCAGKK